MKKIWMLFAALMLAASVWATSLTCSIDDSGLMWTGKTRVEWGKMLYEHRCLQGHRFWLTQEQMDQ